MADMSAESVQQKIAIERRDAENLKDRIKRKKDELADTTREPPCPLRCLLLQSCLVIRSSNADSIQFAMSHVRVSTSCLASP